MFSVSKLFSFIFTESRGNMDSNSTRMDLGNKIKELRNKKGLTQEELADRCELSKGFISQLENDVTSPSIATLIDILQCLGSNLKDFFHDADDEQIVFGRDDFFEKVDAELHNKIEWIIPNAQKNMMEPIRVTLDAEGSTYPDRPHEGEEFGYVLSGSITIIVGNRSIKAKKGGCLLLYPGFGALYQSRRKNRRHILMGQHAAHFLG